MYADILMINFDQLDITILTRILLVFWMEKKLIIWIAYLL